MGEAPRRLPGSLGKRIVLGVVGIAGGTVVLAAAATWIATGHVLFRAIDRDLATYVERVRQFEAMRSRPPSERPPEPPPMPPPAPPAEVKPTEAKPADAKPADAKPADAKPADGAPPRESRRRGPFWGPLVHGDRDSRFLLQLVEVQAGARRVLHASASLPEGSELAADLPDPPPPSLIRDLSLSDGRRVRVATVVAKGMSRDRSDAVVLASLAIDLEPTHAELRRLGWTLGALVLTASVLSLGAALVLRRALIHPVRALGDDIDRLGPDDLAARLPAHAGPAELRSVVSRLNDLLGRLEDAFRREQATLANIAHELRNPVAALRSTIEFRLPAAGEAERRTLEPSLATVLRMQAMVSNLLLLARVESGAERLATEPVDLAALAVEIAEEWEGRAPSAA